MVGKPFDADEPRATFVRSMEEIIAQQQANAAAWGLGITDRWDADLDRGVIKFSNTDGFTVTAPLQVVGTYNSEDGTWLWGWDHPSVDEPISLAARRVWDFGRRHGLAQLTKRKIECSEDDAWQFTALASHLFGATGTYRGNDGPTYVFMVFGKVTIRHVH